MKITGKYSRFMSVMTLLFVGMLGGIGPAAAAETVKINFAGMFAPDHPVTQAQQAFKREVEAATDGRVKVRVFPANQLGDYTQVFEELRRGTIDMGLINIPSQFDPRLEVMYLPYMTTNYQEVRKAYMPGSFLYSTMDRLIGDLGVKFMAFEVDGFGGFGLTKMPDNVSDPNAAKNVLLRVPPMDIFKSAAEDEGFQTVSVPFAELYTSLQTGVADGWSGGSSMLNYLQFRDVIKHFVVSNNFVDAYGWLASDKLWNRLTPQDREIVREAALKYSKQSIDEAEAKDLAHQKKLHEKGIDVIRLSDAELEAWAQRARTVTWPKLRERLTDELIDGAQAAYAPQQLSSN